MRCHRHRQTTAPVHTHCASQLSMATWSPRLPRRSSGRGVDVSLALSGLMCALVSGDTAQTVLSPRHDLVADDDASVCEAWAVFVAPYRH